MERITRTSLPQPIFNASIVAAGSRAVTWSADGTPTVLDTATGRVVLALSREVDRVFGLDDEGALACLRRGPPSEPDVALWDLNDGERIAPLAGLGPRPHSFAIGPDDVTVLHSGARDTPRLDRRMRFDRSGRLLSDDTFEAYDGRMPLFVVVWAARSLVRASPVGELVVLPEDGARDLAIAGALDVPRPTLWRARLSVGGSTSAHVALLAVALRRVRVGDVARRAIVTGAWDALDVRAAFFCGRWLVTATDDALRVHDLAGSVVLFRPLDPVDRIARVDGRHLAIGRSEEILVLDVERDVVVARLPVAPYDGLFGAHGRLIAAHADGTVDVFGLG